MQLFADLSDSESDSEDREMPLPRHVSRPGQLLPPTSPSHYHHVLYADRPFYHIWTSRNPQQALLLPRNGCREGIAELQTLVVVPIATPPPPPVPVLLAPPPSPPVPPLPGLPTRLDDLRYLTQILLIR